MSLNSTSPCGLVGGFLLGRDLKNPFSVSHNAVVVETNRTPVILDRHVHERFCNDFGKITITVQANGYAYFSSENNLLHIWIAETFMGSRIERSIDHINRVTTDNRLANLRWASQSIQNENRGNVRSVERAIELPEIAPGFTTMDLPKYIYYRKSSIEKTGATRGDFFSVERGCIRRKTEYRKGLTLLDKYYQAIAIAEEENILCYADDMDINGTNLRDEAILIFKNHIKQGGAAHPIISISTKSGSIRVSPLPKPNIDSSSSKRKWVNLPPVIVELEYDGKFYNVYKKSGVHIIYDKPFGDSISSIGEWSVEQSEGASVMVRQSIRTNKKATLKGDLNTRFPEMQNWDKDKISLQDFIWKFCMKMEIPESFAIGSRNRIPGDFREANLCLIRKTNNRVPRIVICKPPPGLHVTHGIIPLDLGVAYKPSTVSSSNFDGSKVSLTPNNEFCNFTITGNLLKDAKVTWRGSTSTTLTTAEKYEQALSKLRDVYCILGRDFDTEHDEYVKLILENKEIIKTFESVSSE